MNYNQQPNNESTSELEQISSRAEFVQKIAAVRSERDQKIDLNAAAHMAGEISLDECSQKAKSTDTECRRQIEQIVQQVGVGLGSKTAEFQAEQQQKVAAVYFERDQKIAAVQVECRQKLEDSFAAYWDSKISMTECNQRETAAYIKRQQELEAAEVEFWKKIEDIVA